MSFFWQDLCLRMILNNINDPLFSHSYVRKNLISFLLAPEKKKSHFQLTHHYLQKSCDYAFLLPQKLLQTPSETFSYHLFYLINRKEEKRKYYPGTTFLDHDKPVLPLRRDLYQPQQKFRRFGYTGKSMTLARFLDTKKVPQPLRPHLIYLYDHTGTLVAVPPLSLHHDYAITEETQSLLGISCYISAQNQDLRPFYNLKQVIP